MFGAQNDISSLRNSLPPESKLSHHQSLKAA